MKRLIAAIVCLGAVGFSAVDASAQSRRECDLYARDYANSVTRPGRDAAAGGLLGAGIGAVIGGIAAGRPGAGAAIGAGVGAAGGLAANSAGWQRAYDDAYYDCMRGRRVRYDGPRYDFDGGRYPAGSPEWFDWCRANYRSFNTRTGTYRGYDGYDHYCVVP